jgi:hypothetical protein
MSSGATTCAAAAPSAYASVASEAQPAASRHTGQLAFIVHSAPAVHSTASAAPDAAGSAANTDSPVPAAMRFGRSTTNGIPNTAMIVSTPIRTPSLSSAMRAARSVT